VSAKFITCDIQIGVRLFQRANISKDAFKTLENYGPWPVDDKVIAWPVSRTSPEPEGKPSVQFTIKAQLLHETEEGRQARLQREKEEEEERLRLEKEQDEARKKQEEEEKAGMGAGEEAPGSDETPAKAASGSDASAEVTSESSEKSGSDPVGGAEKDEL